MPARLVDRREVGLRVPLDAWFRSELREMAGEMLLGVCSFVGERMNQSVTRHGLPVGI